MGKEDFIRMKGIVRETYASTRFRVELLDKEGNPTKHLILATISGKLRMNFIKIIKGDIVHLEISPYDLNSGRIVWRD